jgi:23S rRNA pseudouridine2605 synthase
MRLNKYIANAGFCSRRKADELIKTGKVIVDGKKTLLPYTEVNNRNKIKVNGIEIQPGDKKYLLLNKPTGYVSTLTDRHAELKVADLVPTAAGRVFPVGRLDKNSSGLIIMTNDGELALYLTHPRYQVEKEYSVTVSPRFTHKPQVFTRGITEQGEELKFKSVFPVKNYKSGSQLRIVLTEGKKREIRRMMQHFGYSVIKLKRTRINGIKLGSLPEGQYTFMSPDRAEKIKKEILKQKKSQGK